MYRLFTIVLLSTSLAAFPAATPSFAIDASISAKCGPDAPEAYKRPGGYCEQIGAYGSASNGDGSCGQYCIVDDGDGPEDQ
jgi:hypothetical protein